MVVTEFSFLMGVLWSSVILLAGALLTRSKNFVSWFGISGFLIIMLTGSLRLLIPVEILGAAVIGDTVVMPVIQRLLRVEVFSLLGKTVTTGDLLLALWAVGSIFYLAAFIFRIIQQKQVLRKLPAIPSLQYDRIANEIAGKRKYKILVSEYIGSPAIVGLISPTILMPDIELTDAEAEYVFRHEWYHFRHMDLWKKLLFNILCSFLWWNPLMYYIRSKLDYILEINCDYHVVKGQMDAKRVEYVESTLNVLRQITPERPMPYTVAFADTASDLTRRCDLILFPPKSYGFITKVGFCCFAFLPYGCIVRIRYSAKLTSPGVS